MQFLQVSPDMRLLELGARVGARNVESILHLNGVDRAPNIGQAIQAVQSAVADSAAMISAERKVALINTVTSDSDIFEAAALLNEAGWKLMSATNMLPNMLKVPESLHIPDGTDVLGNGQPVKSNIYRKVIDSITLAPHTVDPSIFNDYSSTNPASILEFERVRAGSGNPMQWFKVPWGEITLYCSLNAETLEFPVYPEELSDGVKANYTTMPDLLYQYEPWQLYTGSGPRTQTYTFEFHRDMWTGDHTDGKANELIRGCMANCYPKYRGAAVDVSTVTLYIAGKPMISGVLTDVNVTWSGPIGLDGFYLVCKLELTITEVSKEPLNFDSVRNKPLIG